ncbi:MAG: RNA polymerase sigma factor [Planctomycetota bacterium]
MDDASDEALMSRYVDGDPAAFAELFERYGPRLTALFRRGLPAHVDVSDLVQQTFLQIHRARHDYRPGLPLRPWVVTIALNLRRKHYRVLSRAAQELVVDPSDSGETERRGLERSERAEALHRALEELRPNQREVLELHWFEGLPFAEVARVVGASLSAVKVRAHRAYEALRKTLDMEA